MNETTALSREAIEKSAQDGHAESQIELSLRLEAEGRSDLSIDWLRRAVEGGSLRAKTLLAKCFLTKQPYEVDEGLALLFAASDGGDGEAAHTAAIMHASAFGVERDWDRAFDYLQHSAELGFVPSRKELLFLAGAPPADEHVASELWKELRDSVDINAWITAPRPKWAQKSPRIFVIEKFASPEVCDWLIDRAKPHLVDARTIDPQTDLLGADQGTTNSMVTFDLFRMDMIFSIMWARITSVTGISSGAEAPNILHHAVGESYEPHFDYIENESGAAPDYTQGAQRVVTFLLYLNDDYEGGGTEFPLANWGHRGRKGDAMYFWNVDARGSPDRLSMHTGTAPSKGEKWVLSQWILGRLAQG
jgi:prolyl 4-hydroxylase